MASTSSTSKKKDSKKQESDDERFTADPLTGSKTSHIVIQQQRSKAIASKPSNSVSSSPPSVPTSKFSSTTKPLRQDCIQRSESSTSSRSTSSQQYGIMPRRSTAEKLRKELKDARRFMAISFVSGSLMEEWHMEPDQPSYPFSNPALARFEKSAYDTAYRSANVRAYDEWRAEAMGLSQWTTFERSGYEDQNEGDGVPRRKYHAALLTVERLARIDADRWKDEGMKGLSEWQALEDFIAHQIVVLNRAKIDEYRKKYWPDEDTAFTKLFTDLIADNSVRDAMQMVNDVGCPQRLIDVLRKMAKGLGYR